MPPTSLDEHVERLLDSRAQQGLPRHVDDPATIAKVATFLRPDVSQHREAA